MKSKFGLELDGAMYGCELELADIDTQLALPEDHKWDYKDYSICNSNGTANDPLKKLNRYGSEINTAPAESPEKLAMAVDTIYSALPKKSCNFTTNLHVHIHVPKLKDNLAALQHLAQYIHEYDVEMFHLIDPIPVPIGFSYPSSEAFAGALRRFKRRQRSHHHRVSEKVFRAMITAKTPKEFYESHASKSKAGVLLWHLVTRAGINLKQLWEDTETIEVRCFTCSPDIEKMLSAFKWVQLLFEAIFVTGHSPHQILSEHNLKFQEVFPYNFEQDKIFRLTNVHINGREGARKNYEALIASGALSKEMLI